MTQKDLAEALGISRGQVSKDVARGMPIGSLEAARLWRAQNKIEGIGHKGADDSLTASASAAGVMPARVGGALETAPADPAGTLERMRDVEMRQYALIDAALTRAQKSQSPLDYAVLPGLFRAYNQAGANALAAAASWERHCRAAGEVAPVEHLMNVLTSRLEPLAARLKNFAANVAARANPSAPAVAEAAIDAELKPILSQIAAGMEPIPAAPEAA